LCRLTRWTGWISTSLSEAREPRREWVTGSDLVTCQYSGSVWAAFLGTTGVPGGSTNYLQYNAGSGNFGGIAAFNFSSPNTIAATSSGVMKLTTLALLSLAGWCKLSDSLGFGSLEFAPHCELAGNNILISHQVIAAQEDNSLYPAFKHVALR
jgi:hypothetical protein